MTGFTPSVTGLSAKSRLGEKPTYIHNQWDGLQTFLSVVRVEIYSNRIENLLQPIALDGKNAFHAVHEEDGIESSRIASLIETCKSRVTTCSSGTLIPQPSSQVLRCEHVQTVSLMFLYSSVWTT
ncbi:transposase [Brucella sp. NBRC 12950]|uniref:IS66 family transposase n=1 Tax=Brucella sp. NBRC 12950 TaxID=2994518 RepID=UPI003330411D